MRRTLLWTAALLGAASAGAAARAETLTVSNGLPPTHVVSTHGFDPWMACVKEGTSGAVDFNYFPSGQISTVKESLDALNNGLADVAFVSPSNEGSRMPLAGIANLPGLGQTSAEQVAAFRKVVDAEGPIATEFANNHVHAVVVNVLPGYQIMSGGEPIKTLADFGGHQIRVAGGSQNFTVNSLGGTPVEMPAGDMYVGMQRGTVDATILALSSVKTYAMQELVKSMSTNASLGTSAQMFAMSDEAWERLSPEQRTVLVDCGHEVEGELAAYIDSQDEVLRREFSDLGIELFEFSPEETAAIDAKLDTVAADYIGRLEARGLPAQQAYDAYKAAFAK